MAGARHAVFRADHVGGPGPLVGILLQIVGVGTVAWGLARVRREVFKRPPLFQPALDLLSRLAAKVGLPRRKDTTVLVAGETVLSGTQVGRPRLSTTGGSQEERLARLEAESQPSVTT